MAKRIEDLKEALNKPKSIDEILEEQIDTALEQHRRPAIDLFLSGIAAGLEIGFSVFFMGTIYTLFVDLIHPSFLQILLAFTYPIGFIFVVIGKSELFTEHTTLAVIPVLNKRAGLKSLLIVWSIIYFGNLIGGYVFSLLLANLPTSMGIIEVDSLVYLAEHMLSFNSWQILGSGLLAGWLMGLLSWLVTSSQETISRIFIVGLVTVVIGIGSLHHSIVGSIEVFTGMLLTDSIQFTDYLYFQALATFGNIVGGVVFVALVKYSHINPRRHRSM